jgi:carboxymethylenebutenolidase
MCSPDPGVWPEGSRHEGEVVEVSAADGTKFPVHICKPAGDGPFATVLVIQDWYDPEHYYHELACRYAGAGYLGVVPHLFHREGKLAEQTDELAGARVGRVDEAKVLDDIDSTIEYLKKEGLMGDLVITGFCWGGRIAYIVATRHREAKLLIPFYGILGAFPGPPSPLDLAGQIDSRVLGIYGGKDGYIPVDDAREMERRLKDKGVRADFVIYEEMGHSFFRQPEHQKESDDAWGKVLTALKETVG